MRKVDMEISGPCVFEPVVHGDNRGFFMETFREDAMAKAGVRRFWVQENHSRSGKGILRGLHWQAGRPQAKLMRVVCGAAFDVIVDLRQQSPSFGRWCSVELSEENKKILFVPEGFAHGFLALADGADLLYKCSEYYAPELERGLLWNDPTLGIRWPLLDGKPKLLARDQSWPVWGKIKSEDLF